MHQPTRVTELADQRGPRTDKAPGDLSVVVLTNIAAPYRVALFAFVHSRFRRFAVAYQASSEAGRHWDLGADAPFESQVLPGRRLTIGSRTMHINQGVSRALDAARPDIVIAGGFSLAVAQMMVLCSRRGIRMVIMNDGTDFTDPLRGLEGAYRRWIVRRATGLIAASIGGERYFEALGGEPERIARVQLTTKLDSYWGVALRHEVRSAAIERFHLHGPTLCYVGQLVQRKRPAQAIAIFKRVRGQLGELNLLIAGDGPERATLEESVRNEGLESVRFLGHMDEAGIRDVYAASDLHIFPSVRERYGLVVLESLAAGVPVVTTRLVGAAEDLVVPGETGFVTEPDDVEAMAKCVLEYLGNPDAAPRMRAAAIDRARRHDLPVEAERFVEAVAKFAGMHLPRVESDVRVGSRQRKARDRSSEATRPNVVYVTERLAPYRLPFLRRLNERGVKVVVIEANAACSPPEDTVEEPQPVVHRLRAPNTWRRDVVRLCNAISPDVLLIEHGARHDFTWSLLLDRSVTAKRVLWTHGIENRERFTGKRNLASLGRWAQLRMADAVLCYDRESALEVASRIPGLPTGSAPNSAAGETFAEAARLWPAERRAELKHELGLELDRYIAVVGQMVPGKEMNRLPRILDQVRHDYPQTGVLLVGDGPERKRIEQRFIDHGFEIGRDVIFRGHVPRPIELAKILRAANVVLNPGYIGLVAVDAMFAGVPVILAPPSRVGPFHSPEWIYLRDSVGGLFAAADTDEALAARVVEYFAEPDHQRDSRERECTLFAERFLGIGPMTEGFIDLLSRLGVTPMGDVR